MSEKFLLTAQPIDEGGRIGFDEGDPLEAVGETLSDCFRKMAVVIGAAGVHQSDAWDLTLEVRS